MNSPSATSHLPVQTSASANATPTPTDSLRPISKAALPPSPVNAVEKIQVLCTRSFSDPQLDYLRTVSPRLIVEQHRANSAAELGRMIRPDTEVLFTSLAPETLATAPRLRWLQTRGAGVNQLVGTPVWNSNVMITTASGLHAGPIGEYVVGMMVALARDFLGFLDFQRRACWPMKPRVHFEQFPGRELRGSTVLIVGYGSIGREVARLCHVLGLRIIAVKRHPEEHADSGFVMPGTGDPNGSLPEKFVAPSQLDEVLPAADYVVVSAASTHETRHLIGEPQLRLMRPDAFLINIARGDVIDQSALARALQERWIAGAGLDVFEKEPLPADSPLWQLENVILSPHVAGITPRYDEHVVEIFAENLRRYVAGRELLNLIDRTRGY